MAGLQSSFDPMSIFDTAPTPVPTPYGPAPAPLFNEQSTTGTGFYSGQPVTTSVNQPQIPQNTGDVLGGNTGGSPAPSNGFDMSLYPGWNDEAAARKNFEETGGPQQQSPQQAQDAADARVRGDINTGYEGYFRSLDEQMAGLGGQRTSQEGIVGSQFSQGQADIGLQQTQGLGALQAQEDKTMSNQEKNLKNLTENIRNSMMAGNIYLGSRGAGDSSAANQYSYALTKLGSKARGDVMSQTSDIVQEIGQRETNLRQIIDNETRRLTTDRNTKMSEIAQWFADSQNQIRQAQASGQLSRGTDLANLSKSLLDQAMNRLGQAETESANRRQGLEQWAMNNANTIQQLKANMQQVTNYNPSLPQQGPIASAPIIDQNGGFKVYGGSSNPEEDRSLFGGGTTRGAGSTGSF